MSTLKEQFEAREALKPKPKWVYGDRIFAKYNKIPIVGMVIREDYEDRSMVLVHSDLPVKDGDEELRWVFLVPSKSIKQLKEIL